MIKKILLIFFPIIFFSAGCDSVYKYIFLPPERLEYTLIPDKEAIRALGDSSYFISANGQAVGYDAKNWKIEIRYMTDYQLNTFEFPDDSKSEEYSGNPFTYANWIDPTLGYTPRRFTVFKITIYNYTASKLNFDPEITLLQSDRGDNFHALAREQKNAKYMSMEEYFKKLKGTSGVDEEIFETRMGIARRTMLYYGKPIYKGDSRDGLVVYDPIIEKVEKIKISVPKFIIGYDENNEPSDFIDLNFFFEQIPLDKSSLEKTEILASKSDSTSVGTSTKFSGKFSLAQAMYVDDAQSTIFSRTKLPQIKDIWDPNPEGIKNLLRYMESNNDLKTSFKQISLDELSQGGYNLLLLTGVGASPIIDQKISTLVEFIENGGFVMLDFSSFREGVASSAYKHFQSIAELLKGNALIQDLTPDHPIFNTPKKLLGIPAGYEAVNGNIEPAFKMRGIFLSGRLVALETGKSYSMLWGDDEQKQALDLGLNIALYILSNLKK